MSAFRRRMLVLLLPFFLVLGSISQPPAFAHSAMDEGTAPAKKPSKKPAKKPTRNCDDEAKSRLSDAYRKSTQLHKQIDHDEYQLSVARKLQADLQRDYEKAVAAGKKLELRSRTRKIADVESQGDDIEDDLRVAKAKLKDVEFDIRRFQKEVCR